MEGVLKNSGKESDASTPHEENKGWVFGCKKYCLQPNYKSKTT